MTEESRFRWGRILFSVARVGLAAIFLVAAYAKLKPVLPGPWSFASIKSSLAMFALQVDSYQILSPSRVNVVAHVLPPLELFLGLWLLIGIASPFSTAITTLLVAGFFSLTIRTYAMGLEISCGCFGPGGKLGKMTIVRDGSFLVLALIATIGAFWSHRIRKSTVSARAN
jgi:uncharacterized membrane protein YphA (DoxX/SURF4 family)